MLCLFERGLRSITSIGILFTMLFLSWIGCWWLFYRLGIFVRESHGCLTRGSAFVCVSGIGGASRSIFVGGAYFGYCMGVWVMWGSGWNLGNHDLL